jgi:CO dehydrogenase/acetyl-CoA synthase epsilon subunit
MTAYLTFGETFPWATFSAPLTGHDRAVIAELSKAQVSSPEKARARIAKMLIKKREQSALAVGRRWNSLKNKWE